MSHIFYSRLVLNIHGWIDYPLEVTASTKNLKMDDFLIAHTKTKAVTL